MTASADCPTIRAARKECDMARLSIETCKAGDKVEFWSNLNFSSGMDTKRGFNIQLVAATILKVAKKKVLIETEHGYKHWVYPSGLDHRDWEP